MERTATQVVVGAPAARPAARWVRAPAAVLLACTSGVLALSLWLRPDPSGVGTHRQLGLPPCGTQMTMGLPCPTCGMTTAFAHAARGRLLTALRVQPAGAVLAVVNAMLLVVSAYALAVGLPLDWLGRCVRPSLVLYAGGLVVLAWLYKVMVQARWL